MSLVEVTRDQNSTDKLAQVVRTVGLLVGKLVLAAAVEWVEVVSPEILVVVVVVYWAMVKMGVQVEMVVNHSLMVVLVVYHCITMPTVVLVVAVEPMAMLAVLVVAVATLEELEETTVRMVMLVVVDLTILD